MKATIQQAIRNERSLSVANVSYGHWRIMANHRGKRYHATTTNSEAVDDWHSEPWETDPNNYNRNRKKAGYETLINEIIKKNNLT